MNIKKKEKMMLDYLLEQAQNARDFAERNGIYEHRNIGYYFNGEYIHTSMSQNYESGNAKRIITKVALGEDVNYDELLYEDKE